MSSPNDSDSDAQLTKDDQERLEVLEISRLKTGPVSQEMSQRDTAKSKRHNGQMKKRLSNTESNHNLKERETDSRKLPSKCRNTTEKDHLVKNDEPNVSTGHSKIAQESVSSTHSTEINVDSTAEKYKPLQTPRKPFSFRPIGYARDESPGSVSEGESSSEDEDIDRNTGGFGKGEETPKDFSLRPRIKKLQPVEYYDADMSGTFRMPNKNEREKERRRKKTERKTAMKGKERRFKACTECRLDKQQCSITDWGHSPEPCSRCQEEGLECDFLSIDQGKKRREEKERADKEDLELEPLTVISISSKVDGSSADPDDNSDVEDEDPSPKRRRTSSSASHHIDLTTPAETMRTGLVHPVQFFVGEDDCSWCNDSAYGLAGPKVNDKVLVRPFLHDRLAFHEISGGHRERGAMKSQMCSACCMSRLGILLCPEHHIMPDRAEPVSSEDQIQQFQRLQARKMRADDRWCSLCLNIANWNCKTESGLERGCRLMLCDMCRQGMSRHGLEGFLEILVGEDGKKYGNVRPDAELLKKRGLLKFNLLARATKASR